MERSYIIFLLLFLFFSCTEEITIRTDNSKPVVVIYGELTNEMKRQSVKITWSSPYFDTQVNDGTSGARVRIISSDTKIYELFENETIPCLYETETEWAVEAGITYLLQVEVDLDGNKKTYEASTTILPPIIVDSITIVPMNVLGRKNYTVNLYGNEPEGEDFYLCKYSIGDSLITTKISRYEMFDDTLFDGQYMGGSALTFFDSMENREKDSERRREQTVYLETGNKVEVQISTVSKSYFEFITGCQREMRGSNPFFGGPPVNIVTNITNGGVGFFTGYCISKAEAITP